MAMSQGAALVERVLGHGDNAITEQDISNPANDPERFGEKGEMMKALAWMGKNKVEIGNSLVIFYPVEVPKPKIVEEQDVILKVTGTTVCGSDLHLLHGTVPELEKGDILGHEFCGVVDSVGSRVSKVRVGDRVVASFQIACGECEFCKQKLSSQCERTNSNTVMNSLFGGRTAGIFGYSHLTGGFAGGQAEYVRVPKGDINLLKLPGSVPDERGLFLSDVVATSWNCVVDTGVRAGDVVAIWGAGPIGQMCADFALLHGAARVILIDANWRLEWVKARLEGGGGSGSGGRIELLDYSALPRGSSVPARLKEMVPHGGPDVALECVAGEYAKGWAHYFEMLLGFETDTSEIVNEMITSVKSYGRCGITGVYVGFTNHFNIGSLMERGIRLIGNGQAPVHLYWEKLLAMIERGEIEPLKMVSHRVRLEDLPEVYHRFDRRAPEDAMQKVFVQTRFSGPRFAGSPELTTY